MRNYCSKIPYSSKKEARRSARVLSDSKWGDNPGHKYSQYHCKECGSWHIYTENRKVRKNQNSHARGGRKRWARTRSKTHSRRSS